PREHHPHQCKGVIVGRRSPRYGVKIACLFTVNRTVVTGFSFFCDEDDTAYYVNLMHADVENRLPWSEAKQILDARREDAHWVCHNAPFEITMMQTSLNYELDNVICTLQMAVSAFNADQYDTKVLRRVISERRRDADDIAEEEAVLEMYKAALGMA
ncbi:hypothetical protein SAMN04488078_11583, partial [Antarctobacter heliothermus]